MIPSGLHITEVAHDIQQQVSRFITADLSLVNSYDTWHGTTHNLSVALTCDMCVCMCEGKNVWKQMLQITQGRVRDRGVTWFPEVVDTSTCVYIECSFVTQLLFMKEYKGSSLLGNEELSALC